MRGSVCLRQPTCPMTALHRSWRAALDSCTKRIVPRILRRTQRVPYVVPTTASLARTYRLFRDLGLHHILVTPPSIPVVGLITRTDISTPNAYKASCCSQSAWCKSGGVVLWPACAEG